MSSFDEESIVIDAGSASMTIPRGMHLLHAPYDPVAWRANSNTLCKEAEKACQVSARLRATTAKVIADRQFAEKDVYETLVADRAKSIEAIKAVIAGTEAQIAACEAEQSQLEAQHGACQAGYQAKQEAFGVAVDRLSWRSTRPARELVQDPGQRALANELATLKASSSLLESSAHKLSMDHVSLSKMLEALKETAQLKTTFLQLEEAGAPAMSVLEVLCQPTAPSPFAGFVGVVRPVSALPATRLSLSRIYASR